MKIVTIIGARPQFIKAAMVSRVLRQEKDIAEILLHTGQHYDDNMSKVFFTDLEIAEPGHHLGIHSLSHGAMTGRMLEAIESILQKERPDWVLIYGDTNSTLAGSLAAKKLHLNVAHVEAGMRSFNMMMPEEINRILSDRVSSLLLCSTDTAVKNLKEEGYKKFDCRIVQTGDVMYDAALYYADKAQHISTILQTLPFKEYALCTLHRQENTDNPEVLKRILSALTRIHEEVPVVLPLHPRTRKIINQLGIRLPLHLMNPVGYLDMLMLTQNCRLVLTDSGGLQKEAFFFRKFCITLRKETEWVELVKLKANKTTGTEENKILKAFYSFRGKSFKIKASPYGKGDAAKKVVKALLAT